MILAGDVGGTKTLLGLFERSDPRPHSRTTRSYDTNAYGSFTAILDAFAADVGGSLDVTAAAVGVAGPVIAQRARLTNVDFDISADEIAQRLGTRRVRLLNDLEAMGHSVEVLAADEIEVLQAGTPRSDGNAAVIAAGTGLGQAFLHRHGTHLRPVPSEGGHADFAPRSDREMELARMLRDAHGRAEVEQVLSGPGLVNVHRFTHRGGECAVGIDVDAADAPARVSQSGMSGRCQFCALALSMFVEMYGSEAGNLALRGVTVSGVYIGGGIAPKILPAIRKGGFMRAFLSKPPMDDLLAKVPVKVILNAEAGLIGAAVHAQSLAAAG